MRALIILLAVGVELTRWGALLPAAENSRWPDHQYSSDPFEARRRSQELTDRLVREQAARRVQQVPTFTIPQPSFRYYTPRGLRRMWVPGHWEIWGGRMIYVPGQMVYTPF